jgi:periplasmic protein TonB
MLQPEHLRHFENANAASRRTISLIFVGVFHIFVIYAFASGLANHLYQKLPDELKIAVVKEAIPVKPPPPPPPPDLAKPPPPFVPPPDIVIQSEAPSNSAIHGSSTPPPPAAPKPTGVSAPALISGGAKCQSSYYPPIAIRLNQEGTTEVTVHVGPSGEVQGVDLSNSSGHDDLDQAAIRCITNAWHFKPATENGAAVASTKQYKIIWKLQ